MRGKSAPFRSFGPPLPPKSWRMKNGSAKTRVSGVLAGTPAKKQRGTAAKPGPDLFGTAFCGRAPEFFARLPQNHRRGSWDLR
jgi:hypothetical protein